MSVCVVCKSEELKKIFDADNQPLARYGLSSSLEKARSAKVYPVEILECENCTHMYNSKFLDKSVDYTNAEVQESRVFSIKIKEYMQSEAARLKKFLKKGDCVLEIGCGEGFFLSQFKDNYKCVGFEPSPEGFEAEKLGLEIKHRYFDNGDAIELNPSLIIMRQVLEHISNPREFISSLRESMEGSERNGMLYLEVPNGGKTRNRYRFHDFYYEHVSYFTINSLIKLMDVSGFEVLEVRLSFDEEIIQIFSRVKSLKKPGCDSFKEKQALVSAKINQWLKENKKIVGWGTAGNGSMFFSTCEISTEQICYVVDSDARKQGKYLPKTGQLVISPDQLKEFGPNVIIVLSQFHSLEIAQQARELLGNDVEIVNFF